MLFEHMLWSSQVGMVESRHWTTAFFAGMSVEVDMASQGILGSRVNVAGPPSIAVSVLMGQPESAADPGVLNETAMDQVMILMVLVEGMLETSERSKHPQVPPACHYHLPSYTCSMTPVSCVG